MTDERFRRNPYVGPRPFEPEHRDLFFGRDREAADLASLVTAHPTVLLYAQSGAGKTSLVNAGLIPRLQNKGFEVLSIARVRGSIPEHMPSDAVANPYVLNTLISWADAAANPYPLSEMSVAAYLAERVRQLDSFDMPRPRVAVFDQFEELFTFYPERWPDRAIFLEQVTEALEQDRLLRVVFVLREEYLAQLDPHASIYPQGLRTRFRLERLREHAALSAITGPLVRTGRSYAPGVAEQLVDQLLQTRIETRRGKLVEVAGEYVEPVQLQVVCESLWRELPEEVTVITKDHLRAFGDVDQALAAFYERSARRAARKAGATEGKVRACLERSLITSTGTRGTAHRGERQTGGMPNEAVDVLEDLHLVRGEWRAGARWYELTHDRFVGPIRNANSAWRGRRGRRIALWTLAAVAVLACLALVATGRLVPQSMQQAAAATAEQVATVVEQTAAVVGEGATVAKQTAAVVGQTATVVEQTATKDAATAQAAAATGTAVAKIAATARLEATASSRQAAATATQIALALLPVETLQRMLTDASPIIRTAAATALGQASLNRSEVAVEVVPLLVGRLSDEGVVSVRRAAASALATMAEATPGALIDAAPELSKALADADREVRLASARALASVGPYVQERQVASSIVRKLEQLLADQPDPDVEQAAQEALQAFVRVLARELHGYWANVDPNTRGITRIEISGSERSLIVHPYGKCHPTDCDWGEIPVTYAGLPLVVPHKTSFSAMTLTMTLEVATERLVVETFTRYTDNSGRTDYAAKYTFARGQPAPLPTPTATPDLLTPGDKLFVALFWEREGLAIVDQTTARVERTVSFSSINARYVSANPARQEVYVSLANGDTFYVLDARSGAIKGTIQDAVGWNSDDSVVSPEGDTVYLATSGGSGASKQNKILVIDPERMQVTQVIRLGPYAFPNGLEGLEISPDGTRLYTIDLSTQELLQIETSTGEVIDRQPAPGTRLVGISQDGQALYVSADDEVQKIRVAGNRRLWRVRTAGHVSEVTAGEGVVYVCVASPSEAKQVQDAGTGQVLRVDDRSGRVTARWAVDGAGGSVLSQDGTRLYVTSAMTDSIYILDAHTGQETARIRIIHGSGPTDIVSLRVQTLLLLPTRRVP